MEAKSQYEYCNLVVTPKMDAFIQQMLQDRRVPDHLLKYFDRTARDLGEQLGVPFRHFHALYQMAANVSDRPCLHHLLAGTQIILPKPAVEERSPELEARLEKLRAEQANREYAMMTRNVGGMVSSKKCTDDSVSSHVKSMNRQLTFVMNFLLTVGCAFVFGYKAAELSLPAPNVPMQLICGMVLALVVFVADLYFMMKSDLNL